MIEAMFTLLGTIIGVLLTVITTAMLDGRREKRQARSVRTLLKLEITLNLDALQNFWAKVSTLSEAQEDADSERRALALQFAKEPFPRFETDAFESQLSHLPSALKEQEVLQVLRFYDRLRMLESIRADLTASLSEQRQELQAATKGGAGGGFGRVLDYLPPCPFNEKASRLWGEVERLVNQTLAERNPFGSES